MQKYSLRGGNCGWLDSLGRVRCSANNCLRAILVRDRWGQPVVRDKRARATFAVGEALETYAVWRLKEENAAAGQCDTIEQDVEITEELSPKTVLMGHTDIVNKTTGMIYEHKSISSVNSYKKIIVEGHYKPENLAQLVNYMLMWQKGEGILLYTSGIYPGGKGQAAGDQRAFQVHLEDNGDIIVDGVKETRLNCLDIYKFREEAVEVLESGEIYPHAPESYDIWPVCNSCWLNDLCQEYKNHGSAELFSRDVQNLLALCGKR